MTDKQRYELFRAAATRTAYPKADEGSENSWVRWRQYTAASGVWYLKAHLVRIEFLREHGAAFDCPAPWYVRAWRAVKGLFS